jgi:hypothetical protein
MDIHVSVSPKRLKVLQRLVKLSGDATLIKVSSPKELSADDYRKAAVLNGGRILAKSMRNL